MPRQKGSRFVVGHSGRNWNKDYATLTIDGDRKPIHIIRAENALGRPLPPGAVVHHADGSRSHLAPLVICQDNQYHLLLHVRMRVKAAGGNPNTDARCAHCKKTKPFAAFAAAQGRRYGLDTRCRACMSTYRKNLKARRRAAA